MGVLYRARQLRLERVVALKMVLYGAHASTDRRMRFRADLLSPEAMVLSSPEYFANG
jgi:hypothetical protein